MKKSGGMGNGNNFSYWEPPVRDGSYTGVIKVHPNGGKQQIPGRQIPENSVFPGYPHVIYV